MRGGRAAIERTTTKTDILFTHYRTIFHVHAEIDAQFYWPFTITDLAFCSYKFLCGTINGEVHTGTNGHWHLFWRKYSDGGSQVVWGGSARAALQAMKKWVNHSSGTHEVMHLSIFTIHFQTCECLANTTKEAVLDLHFAVI